MEYALGVSLKITEQMTIAYVLILILMEYALGE